MKKHIYGLFVLVFIITLQRFYVYAEIPEPQEPSINQHFIDFINIKQAKVKPDFDGSAKNYGYIPVPYPKNTGMIKNTKNEASLSTPPASFDLRSENYTTSVKNQGNCGSCWAFASLGAIESNWLINDFGEYDLSENNMKNCHNFLWSACDGGNSEIASSYLTSKGLTSENDDRYRDYNQNCNSSVNPSSFITNLFYLPNRSNSGYEDIIKNVIMEHGGVFTSMTWSERCYNSTAKTYRYSGTAVQNHAVLLVGWNDNLTVTVNGSTSTGAWIVKNSWGSSWGDNGYFYIAYNDTRINGETAVWTSKENESSIEKLFFYDEVGAVRQIGFNSNTGYALIKFTATGNQTISKIGTWINSYNTTISIEVYGNFQNNTLSNLLGSMSDLGCDYPGYYTFDLENPISLNSNSDFYIKVQYYTPNYRYPIPIERYISGYCAPNIETGKCWISNTARTWLQTGSDTRYPYDVCIRAYATLSNNSSIEVVTNDPQEISSNSATLGGNVRANSIEVINKGVCWSQNANPTIRQNRTTNGSGSGSFSSGLNNLNQGTTYYFRAYAITSNDTIYGEESSFITLSLPTVTNTDISNITSSSAILSASVTNDGNSTVTERGFYYSNSPNTDTRANKLTSNSGVGSFNITVTNLSPGRTYYVKSFATNSVGTAYGDEISFITSTLSPTVSSGSCTDITSNSAVITGNVSDDGGASVTERGICFSTNNNPDINSTKAASGSGLGSFSASLNNLNINTTYYARAYAINSVGTSYGDQISFSTGSLAPTVSSGSCTDITSNSAVISGNVTDDGGASVTERGICFSTNNDPDINSTKAASGSGLGSFSATLTNLNPNTLYYARAYAINSVGTSYGDQISFSTGSLAPTVSSGSCTDITSNSAVISGNVTDDGGASVTERGICFSTNNNPDINSTKAASGSGLGSFSATLTNLNPNTLYYARAYAINSVGTSYGSIISFTTEEEQQEEEEVLSPTVQDYNIIISNISSSSVNLSWTRGNGAGSFVVIRQDYSISTNEYPQSNVQYNNFNNDFSQAPSIGNGKIAYFGNANSLAISGLRAVTRYYVRIFAYNGYPSNGTSVFNEETATNNPVTFRTARYKEVLSGNSESFSFNLEQIYPSPATDKINMNVFISVPCDLSIKLLDINGNTVMSNYHINLDKGNNIITINSDSLPSGYYLIMLSNGQEIIIDSIVIAH